MTELDFDSLRDSIKTGVITEHGGEKLPVARKSYSFDSHMPKNRFGTQTIAIHAGIVGFRRDLKIVDTCLP